MTKTMDPASKKLSDLLNLTEKTLILRMEKDKPGYYHVSERVDVFVEKVDGKFNVFEESYSLYKGKITRHCYTHYYEMAIGSEVLANHKLKYAKGVLEEHHFAVKFKNEVHLGLPLE